MLHKDARKKHSRKRILRSIHCAMIRVVTVSNLRTFPSKLSLRQICSHAALQVLMPFLLYILCQKADSSLDVLQGLEGVREDAKTS